MSTQPPSALPLSTSGGTPRAVAEGLAREAGSLAMSRFQHAGPVQTKGRGNVVTEVDLAVERLLSERLSEEYPDSDILSEESAPEGRTQAAYQWILDPIDGTKNFSQGIPYFAINIALARHDEVVVAVTYDPCRQELFSAEAGKGAWLNGEQMHVANKQTVQESLVGSDIGYDNQRAQYLLEFFLSLWPNVQSLRISGSAALGLAYVAAGRLDLYLHHDVSRWDVAPGILLVREAGGLITERDNSPASLDMLGFVAGNAQVHADLLRLAGEHPWRWAGLR